MEALITPGTLIPFGLKSMPSIAVTPTGKVWTGMKLLLTPINLQGRPGEQYLCLTLRR